MTMHNGVASKETQKKRVATKADDIAAEWVTEMRLTHVLDKLLPPPQPLGIRDIPELIKAMLEDVLREGVGEIVDSKEARRAISKRTIALYKQRLKDSLRSEQA